MKARLLMVPHCCFLSAFASTQLFIFLRSLPNLSGTANSIASRRALSENASIDVVFASPIRPSPTAYSFPNYE